MAITDEQIRHITHAAELDRAISESLDMIRQLEREKSDFLVVYEQHKSRMLAALSQMTALRTAMKISLGV